MFEVEITLGIIRVSFDRYFFERVRTLAVLVCEIGNQVGAALPFFVPALRFICFLSQPIFEYAGTFCART
jgi:hypothetical protein